VVKPDTEMENKIPITIIEKIKNEVVQKLGVESAFKLNDKIDGIFYLNKQLKRVLSIYVVDKLFQLNIFNKEKHITSKSFFIDSNNKKCMILGNDLTDKIKIPNEDVEYYLIVCFFDHHKRYKYIGKISKVDCLNKSSEIKNTNSVVSKDIIAILNLESIKENNDKG
jgi:hypothetical protein